MIYSLELKLKWRIFFLRLKLSFTKWKSIRLTFDCSGGKSGKPFGGRLSLSSMKGRPGMGSETSLTGSGAIRVSYGSSKETEMEGSIQALQKASLYVFGEKSQVKNIKIDPHIKVDFIPVDYPGEYHYLLSPSLVSVTCRGPATESEFQEADAGV